MTDAMCVGYPGDELPPPREIDAAQTVLRAINDVAEVDPERALYAEVMFREVVLALYDHEWFKVLLGGPQSPDYLIDVIMTWHR